MTTWIALLRGINLGPRNKIATADLRAVLIDLGHGDVRTHILSGKAIVSRFGLRVAVILRIAAELAGG